MKRILLVDDSTLPPTRTSASSWSPPATSGALCESERVQQVLQNLVGNAIHFTPARSGVRIRARRNGGFVSVAVEDEGPGIPPDQIDHVFDRYWRGRGASRQGIGLGSSSSAASSRPTGAGSGPAAS